MASLASPLAVALSAALSAAGGGPGAGRATGEPIRVFTTRVDTIFGATCVILAPEHPLSARLVAASDQERLKAMVDDRARRARRHEEPIHDVRKTEPNNPPRQQGRVPEREGPLRRDVPEVTQVDAAAETNLEPRRLQQRLEILRPERAKVLDRMELGIAERTIDKLGLQPLPAGGGEEHVPAAFSQPVEFADRRRQPCVGQMFDHFDAKYEVEAVRGKAGRQPRHADGAPPPRMRGPGRLAPGHRPLRELHSVDR